MPHVRRLRVAECVLRALERSPSRECFYLRGELLLRVWMTPPRPLLVPVRLELGLLDGLDEQEGFKRLCAACSDDVEECRIVRPTRRKRILLTAILGGTPVALSVEIRAGDALALGLQPALLPPLVDGPPIRLLTCPRETLVAERLQELVAGVTSIAVHCLALHDLYLLAANFNFDGAALGQAIQATFARRHTPLPGAVPAHGRSAPVHWMRMLRNSGAAAIGSSRSLALVRRFLDPPLARMATGLPPAMTWPPGGPWRQTGHWRYG